MDDKLHDPVLIEAAYYSTPTLFHHHGDNARQSNFDSAMLWFKYNYEFLNKSQYIYQINRIRDSFVWHQDDLENLLNL